MADEKRRVEISTFDGTCAECGGPADAYPTDGTATIELKSLGGQLAICGLKIVKCVWEGHAYYTLDRDKEILDPFAPPAPE